MSDSVLISSMASVLRGLQDTNVSSYEDENSPGCEDPTTYTKILALSAVIITFVVFVSGVMITTVVMALKVRRFHHRDSADDENHIGSHNMMRIPSDIEGYFIRTGGGVGSIGGDGMIGGDSGLSNSNSITDFYEIAPPMVNRPPPRPTTTIRQPSIHGIIQEEPEDSDDDGCGDETPRSQQGRSPSSTLWVPDHSNLERSKSQEMIDKLQILIFTDDVVDFGVSPTPEHDRRRSSAGSTMTKWRLSNSGVLDNLMFKKRASSSAEAKGSPPQTSSHHGSSSPRRTSLAAAFPLSELLPHPSSPSSNQTLRSPRPSYSSSSPRLYKSAKSMFDVPDNHGPLVNKQHSKQQHQQSQSPSSVSPSPSSSSIFVRSPNIIRGKQIQKMVAAFGGGGGGASILGGGGFSVSGNSSPHGSVRKVEEDVVGVRMTRLPSVTIFHATKSEDPVKVPPIRIAKERLRKNSERSLHHSSNPNHRPRKTSDFAYGGNNGNKVRSVSTTSTPEIVMYRGQRRSGITFHTMDSKDSSRD